MSFTEVVRKSIQDADILLNKNKQIIYNVLNYFVTINEDSDGVINIDIPALKGKTISIGGISKIIFKESITLESKRHFGISSGWKNSHNHYKIGINNDYQNNETLDEYMDRLTKKQNNDNTRKYPKRNKKYRKNVNKFFRN